MITRTTSARHDMHRSTFTAALGQSNDVWGRIALMRKLEYWNISWWVAQTFTWGSVVWVVNGFADYLPFCSSRFAKNPQLTGWTAFVGATIFEIGSIFGIWEVLNADWMTFESRRTERDAAPDGVADMEKVGGKQGKAQMAEDSDWVPQTNARSRWVWFTVDPKYWHDLGWYGAFFQLLAASIFWISGFTALPAIQSAIDPRTGVLDGVFWVPQVVGGMGFIISAAFIMLEAQHAWWIPRPLSMRWHVGFWNFLGGVGFTLSAIFGFYAARWGQYQSALSTFWGGWAFLIASVIQWYSSVNRD